jgi:ABC-type Fe3+-siderophore transport system permease subunit
MTLIWYLRLIEVMLFPTYGMMILLLGVVTGMLREFGYNLPQVIGINILIGLICVFVFNPVATIFAPWLPLQPRDSLFDSEPEEYIATFGKEI